MSVFVNSFRGSFDRTGCLASGTGGSLTLDIICRPLAGLLDSGQTSDSPAKERDERLPRGPGSASFGVYRSSKAVYPANVCSFPRAMLVVVLAAIASVGALLVACLGLHRESAHPPRVAALPPRAERTMPLIRPSGSVQLLK